jgi:hypothetical protein
MNRETIMASITAIINRRKQELPSPLKGKRTIFSEAVEMMASDRDQIQTVKITLIYKTGTVIELRDPDADKEPREMIKD